MTLHSGPSPRMRAGRAFLVAAVSAVALVACIALASRLALARVPQERVALQKLVRAQTGLDLSFAGLGLRWGWYGPEAVFEHVTLEDPASGDAVLRSPQLLIGFDTWRTLRSGQPVAGRIELVSPDIHLAMLPRPRPKATESPSRGAGRAVNASSGSQTAAVNGEATLFALLSHWRGGRVTIEGGSVRLPPLAPQSAEEPLTVAIGHASLRRTGPEDWSLWGLVFPPGRIGRAIRLEMRARGNLAQPQTLSGKLRLEIQQLSLSGCRQLLLGGAAHPYFPTGGSANASVDLEFARGRFVVAAGRLQADHLRFVSVPTAAPLEFSRLDTRWRLAHRDAQWQLRLDALDLPGGIGGAGLSLAVADSGNSLRGEMRRIRLASVVAAARWVTPELDLAGVSLDGLAQDITFDWDAGRAAGARLRTAAQLEAVRLEPASKAFTLSGLAMVVAGNEWRLAADVESRRARLELAGSRQPPLGPVRVASAVRLESVDGGWSIRTDALSLWRAGARMSLSGELRGRAGHPAELDARGTMTGADVGLLAGLLGDDAVTAFGAAAARLTAGRIEAARFAMRGPLDDLPFGATGSFTGSLALKDATVSGGGQWPDVVGLGADVAWAGPHLHATVTSARAGAFRLQAASADWDATGVDATRLSGRVSGRLEDALAWVRTYPALQSYAADLAAVDASGRVDLDLEVSLPQTATPSGPAGAADGMKEIDARSRVAAHLDGVVAVVGAGLPPISQLDGTLVLEQGHLQHSVLAGSWLGGPLLLTVDERRERGARALRAEARGTLGAQRVVALVDPVVLPHSTPSAPIASGNADWTAGLTYVPRIGKHPVQWRMRIDSNLTQVATRLPAPFAKRPGSPMLVSVQLTGGDAAAQMQVRWGAQLRGAFGLDRLGTRGWQIERGRIEIGGAEAVLPTEAELQIAGSLDAIDLPGVLGAWQQLSAEELPPIHARLEAGEVSIGGQHFRQVALEATRQTGATRLQIDADAISGGASWPDRLIAVRRSGPEPPDATGSWPAVHDEAAVHLTRLDLDAGELLVEALAPFGALASSVDLRVDALALEGRPLGRLSALIEAGSGWVRAGRMRLSSDVHEGQGDLDCRLASPAPDESVSDPNCHLDFEMSSSDMAKTLTDFGFRPDLAATLASVHGNVDWHPVAGEPWVAGLTGRVGIRLTDGSIRSSVLPASAAGAVVPFALLAAPVFVGAFDGAGAAASEASVTGLHFDRLAADFTLSGGDARTDDLHFDGDTEILMHGRTGLIAHDYDQRVWVLRGSERLPAAIRQFGATPRMAAAWLSLRQLFLGGEARAPAGALRLQGAWDAPIVSAQ